MSVQRRGRTFGLVAHLADGRVAVWGDAPGGRMRALVFDGDGLVALLPVTERARTPAQCAALIASAQYGPRVMATVASAGSAGPGMAGSAARAHARDALRRGR